MGLLTALACVLACITAFIMAWYLPVWPGDQALLAAIQQWQSPPLTATLETMTHLGWYPVTGTLALVAMTTLLLNKHAGDALLMAMAIASAPAIHPLKDLIGRPRPDQAIIDHVHLSMGFPSGHAACAMLLGGALIYLTWQYVREPRLRLTIIAGLATLILAVGISRIHLGLHWPSDLLGGYFYGASVILLAVQARVFWPQVRRLCGGCRRLSRGPGRWGWRRRGGCVRRKRRPVRRRRRAWDTGMGYGHGIRAWDKGK